MCRLFQVEGGKLSVSGRRLLEKILSEEKRKSVSPLSASEGRVGNIERGGLGRRSGVRREKGG